MNSMCLNTFADVIVFFFFCCWLFCWFSRFRSRFFRFFRSFRFCEFRSSRLSRFSRLSKSRVDCVLSWLLKICIENVINWFQTCFFVKVFVISNRDEKRRVLLSNVCCFLFLKFFDFFLFWIILNSVICRISNVISSSFVKFISFEFNFKSIKFMYFSTFWTLLIWRNFDLI